MLLEMHAHTAEFSACSHVTAVDLVRQVFLKGLQGIVLTDHHHLWPAGDLQALRRAAEVPDYFLLLAGQEISTSDFGDVLVYGVPKTLLRHTPVRKIRASFPNAALVWAHPYRESRIPADQKLLNADLDAIEIFNSNHTVRGNSRALNDWHRLRFTAVAGTDTHGKSYAGTYPTIFDHPVATIEDLAQEIRRGRCRPFLKEIPKSGVSAQVLEVTIGTKGLDESRERIIIKSVKNQEKWQSAARGFAIMKEISAHGFNDGSFRVPLPIDADEDTQVVIEQGLRGKSLYDRLTTATLEEGKEYVRLAARWLARLHNCRLVISPQDEFLPKEGMRFERYLQHFADSGNPHTRKLSEIIEAVRREEEKIATDLNSFVQGHGDYHPKNIFLGRDAVEQKSRLFVAAIDFESSMVLPPAFDAGCFLAQFRNQFYNRSEIVGNIPESIFLDAYLEDAENPAPHFLKEVELFKARINLSIASYLINVGLGEGENLWRVLVEAERSINVYNAG